MIAKYLQIVVKTRSSRNQVIKQDKQLIVYVTQVPVKGEANKKVIELLAEYLGLSKYCIEIVKGRKTKNKLIKVVCQ